MATNGIETKAGIHSIAFHSQSSSSANGSVLIAGSGGSLVTSAGTWTFNSVQGNGGYEILLNRASAGRGYADSLYVENGGQMCAQNRRTIGTYGVAAAGRQRQVPYLLTGPFSTPVQAEALSRSTAFGRLVLRAALTVMKFCCKGVQRAALGRIRFTLKMAARSMP